jgi:hypothetical protein
MGWLTGHSDPQQKIIDEEWSYSVYVMAVAYGDDVPPRYRRDVTMQKYRYVGMTYAAAVACRDAIHNPPTVEAQCLRENEAGAYYVAVMERTDEVVYDPLPEA